MIISQQILDFLSLLKKPNTISDLKFAKILSVDKTKIKVAYLGHEEGGSYVYGKWVAPQYVLDLEWTLNRKVVWLEDESIGRAAKLEDMWHWGSDVYVFNIFYNKIVDKKKYVPEGKLYRIDAHRAFARDCGHEWCLLMILHQFIMRTEKGYADLLLEKGLITFRGERIARVVEYVEPRSYTSHGHNVSHGRTHWKATYEYLDKEKIVSHKVHAIMETILNTHLKAMNAKVTCEDVHEKTMPNTGDKLHFVFSTGKIFVGGSDYRIPDKKDMKMILDSAITIQTYDKYYRRKNIYGHVIEPR